jgi:hypothetical protein
MSDASDSEQEEVKPAVKTKIFVNNLDGFLQRHFIKELTEQGNYEVIGSIKDPSKKPVGVLSIVAQVY